MKASFYAIRLDVYQLVAAEVDDRQVAEYLEAGQPVLLATPPELAQLAWHSNRMLVVLSPQTFLRTNHALARHSANNAGRVTVRREGQDRSSRRLAAVQVA